MHTIGREIKFNKLFRSTSQITNLYLVLLVVVDVDVVVVVVVFYQRTALTYRTQHPRCMFEVFYWYSSFPSDWEKVEYRKWIFVPHLILECVCVWSVDRSIDWPGPMKPSPSSYAKCTIFTPFSAHTKPICLDQFIFSLFDSRTQFTCFVFLFWSSTDSMSFQSRQ